MEEAKEVEKREVSEPTVEKTAATGDAEANAEVEVEWRRKRTMWDVLDWLTKIGTLLALFCGLAEFKASRDQRARETELRAWELLRAGVGQRANQGRSWALEYLLAGRKSLSGLNLDSAILPELKLPSANVSWGSFRHAELSGSDFRGLLAISSVFDSAVCESTQLRGAVLAKSWIREANLHMADLRGSYLMNVRFNGSRLANAVLDSADLTEVNFRGVDLTGASLRGVKEWTSIRDIEFANIHDVKAPAGFTAWAMQRGAVDMPNVWAHRDSLRAKRLRGWNLFADRQLGH